MKSEAVVLLNMGAPNSIFEIENFLKNMFNDPLILGIKNDFMRKM
ncbi:ferrochelatase, partial [uncultured Helicobacter sp.]